MIFSPHFISFFIIFKTVNFVIPTEKYINKTYVEFKEKWTAVIHHPC